MGKETTKNQRIQVFARCRPINNYERRQNSHCAVDVNADRKEIRVSDEKMTNRAFIFDRVFGSETKQIAVYKAVVAPLIREVLTGYNCTVFAYGQTGTGKTFTMEGERTNTSCSWEEDPNAGLIPRSLHQLFEELTKEENIEFSVHVSFLELYNEELFDLLSQNDLSKLRLFEDSTRKGSVVIQGLEEIKVNSKDDVYTILEQGTARRQKAATLLNATSSRSHTVFSVTVHIKENTIDGEELLKTGKLNLVDLAGSENIGRSGASQKTAREAGNINQSLLTLGRVITSLVEKAPHVPYRESKLTRLLQDSLGGHTKTSIIATVSPALINIEETLSTLDYAQRAKNITIKPEVNQKMTKKALIKEYTEEIERLRKDLNAAREQYGVYIDTDNYNSMMQTISEKTNKVVELENEITDLSEKLEALTVQCKKVETLFTETEQKLCKTTTQLNSTTKMYTETQQQLFNTQETLKDTKQSLNETSLDRDKKKYVIEVQKADGKQLFDQTKSLLHTVEESSSDVSALHEKIYRKQIVETTNMDCSSTFRVQMQNQLVEVQDDLIVMDKYMKETFKSTQSYINEISAASRSQNSIATAALNLSNSTIQEFSRLLGNLVEVNSAARSKDCQDISQLIQNQLEEFTNVKNVLLEQKSQVESIAKNNLVDLKSHLNQMKEEVSHKIAEHSALVSAAYSTHSQSLKSIMDNYDKFASNMIEERKTYEHCIAKDWKEEEANLLRILNERIVKFGERYMDRTSQNFKFVSKNVEDHYCTIRNEVQNMQTRVEEIQTASSNCNESLDNYQMDSLTKATSALEEISGCLKSSVDITTSQLQSLDKNQQEQSHNILRHFDNEITKNSHFVEDFMKHTEESKSSVQSANCENIAKLDDGEKNIKALIHQCDLTVEDLLNSMPQKTEAVKDALLKSDNLVEKFISEELVKDIPTGTTPARKTYEYPKYLKCMTSPSIIEEDLQSKLAAAATAVNQPLLDSSLEEPLENETDKVPIYHDSQESDSDSSISSQHQMSDASYDGGKNKENNPMFRQNSSIPRRVARKKIQQRKGKCRTNIGLLSLPKLTVFSSSENLANDK